MTGRLYLDLHILHPVPPSNLNRDDSGSPKQAMYGGVRRARVSSQAWKRATRVAFANLSDRPDLATRTTKISALLAALLQQRCGITYDEAHRLAAALLSSVGIKLKHKKGNETAPAETPYLLFFGRKQLERIIDLVAGRAGELCALDDDGLAAEVKDLPVADQLGSGHPVDVALFGRMVAERTELNVDAACQVAHALSTHAVDTEFDYYTAIDDADDRQSSASVIGTVEFNSATLYRYATLAVHLLDRNLDDHDAAADAAELFVDCFTRSMPAGHRNSFAHRTMPQLVVIALRSDQPVNLVSAFEEPVDLRSGVTARSAVRLARELTAMRSMWGSAEALVAATYTPPEADADVLAEAFGEPVAFPSLLQITHDEVARWLKSDP